MSAIAAYLLLGSAGSGRRALATDLIKSGLEDGARVALLGAATERPPPDGVAARPDTIETLIRVDWTVGEDGRMAAALPPDVSHVFVIADGRANPVDQVEAFQAWLADSGCVLARVITVVDCALGQAHPELLRWFDACVHFSDVVLLNRRTEASNAWTSEFTGRLRKEHLPCLVEIVKNDQVRNPAVVLEPQARRLSTLFDDPADWPELDEEELVDSGSDLVGKTDPYVERLPSGRRAREIPDIAKFLDR